MKAVVKGDEVLAAGMISGQLHRGLDRLRPRISEIDLLGKSARRQLAQTLRQLHHVGKIEVSSGNMDQLLRLRMNGLDYFRMRVARSAHGDAGGKVEEDVAVDVLHHSTRPAFRHEGIIAGIGRRDIGQVLCEDLSRFRSG